MDKKLKRVIGYIPSKGNTEKEVIKAEPLKEEEKKITAASEKVLSISEIFIIEQEKVKKIVAWINSHPEFKWGVMCEKIGIDKGNFHRTLKSDNPKIKVEFIGKIEDFLKEYGYAK